MSKEKLPPQSIEAEQSVLGGLLRDPASIVKIADRLTPQNFYSAKHRHIYEAICWLFSKNNPIDIVTVSDRLKDIEKLDVAGGRAYINDLVLGVISAANIEYYAKIVADKSQLRELGKAGGEIAEMIYEDLEPAQVIDAAEQLLFNACQRRSTEGPEPVGGIVNDSYNQIISRYEKNGELAGLPSGFYDLDLLTSGFQKSDLIIIAARPSMGKTAFCLNIAQEVGIRKRQAVAIFSLEMSKDQLVQRMMCSEAEIDSNRVRTGNMQADDWTKLANVMHTMSDAPVFIDDTPGVSVMDIRAKCRRLSMKEELGLIIIDYLQLMEGSDRKQNREQEISTISRGLKNLARELGVPIIALSQLSRAVESRSCKRPMLSDLRESGAIEQDADIVMFIYREEYYDSENIDKKGKADIIIAKQRNGPTGNVELLFQNNITKFKNPVKGRI